MSDSSGYSRPPQMEQDFRTFFGIELAIYLAQVATFVLVLLFLSNFLSSEDILTKVLMAKLEGNGTLKDFAITLLATFTIYGMVSALAFRLKGGPIGRIAQGILEELPRSLYLFGANLTAVCLVGASYLHSTSESIRALQFCLYAVVFTTIFFGVGLVAKYWVSGPNQQTLHKEVKEG